MLLHKRGSHLIVGNLHLCGVQLVVRCYFGRATWKKGTLTQIFSWKRERYFNSLFGWLWTFFSDTKPKISKCWFPKGKVQCKSEIWANSGRYCRIGKPSVLKFMVIQRVRHDLELEQQQQFYMVPRSEKLWLTCQIIFQGKMLFLWKKGRQYIWQLKHPQETFLEKTLALWFEHKRFVLPKSSHTIFLSEHAEVTV